MSWWGAEQRRAERARCVPPLCAAVWLLPCQHALEARATAAEAEAARLSEALQAAAQRGAAAVRA
eukprot:COSAG01_NODE_3685_length_5797_cov_4.035802_4_plen_65_part_00